MSQDGDLIGFDNFPLLALWDKVAVSDGDKDEMFLDTSTCPPKHLVISCDLISFDLLTSLVTIPKRQNASLRFFEFGCRKRCFLFNFSSRTLKMTPEHFLNGPNQTKTGRREHFGTF